MKLGGVVLDISIECGSEEHIDQLEKLYDYLNDYLESGTNYPGWKKGVYPTREDAILGIENKELFVAKHKGEIVGSIILNHDYDDSYNNVKWGIDCKELEVFIVHTFLVHPKYQRCNIGEELLNFAYEYSVKLKAKSIRLDVYEKNIPAIRLYEKCGFKYIDKVDLGLGEYGLDWFNVYEKLL